MSDRKNRLQALLSRLQARSGTLEFQDFKDWLSLQLEEAKDSLITCSPETFQKQQGEAAALQKLIRQLERPSLTPKLNGDS